MLTRVLVDGEERNCIPKKPIYADPVSIYRQPRNVFRKKEEKKNGDVKVYTAEEVEEFKLKNEEKRMKNDKETKEALKSQLNKALKENLCEVEPGVEIEIDDDEWIKCKSRRMGCSAKHPPAIRIYESRTVITIYQACNFNHERADIYHLPQGAGKGFKLAIVGSEMGSFNLRKKRRSASGSTELSCTTLLRELRIKPGVYEVTRGRVHNGEALIIDAFSE